VKSVSSFVKKQVKDFVKNKDLFFLSLPGLLLIIVFAYLPMFGLIIAFKDFRYDLGFIGSPWVGLKNFEFLFKTQFAWRITKNTLVNNFLFYSIGLVVQVGFALILYELTRKAVKLYQTVMFFPHFLSWVVVSYVVIGILDMDSGFANGILKALGMEPIFWYNEPKYWTVILVLSYLWKTTGYWAVIYYAALLGIDNQYYEAAALDGATRLQQIRHISIPFLIPLICIVLILNIGQIFRADFGLFYQVTRNSSALYKVTDVIDTFVYRNAFLDIGMGAATGFYQSVVGLILVLAANKAVKMINSENALF